MLSERAFKNLVFYEISAEKPCKEKYIHDFDWQQSAEEMFMKRIAVLFFTVIPIALFISCDGSKVDGIAVYAEFATTIGTAALTVIIPLSTT